MRPVVIGALALVAAVPVVLLVRAESDGRRAVALATPTTAPTTLPTTGPTTAPTIVPTTAGIAEQTPLWLPKPEDFSGRIHPVSTTCGLTIRPAPELADQRIAHCRVAYRPVFTYHGRPLDPAATYTVGYEVLGTVNGGESYKFTISGTRMRGLRVQTGVPSPGISLTAIANEVTRVP